MSPRRRFRVVLTIGRTLTREIDAADADQAMAIGEYLYAAFGDRDFRCDAEDVVDINCLSDEEMPS